MKNKKIILMTFFCFYLVSCMNQIYVLKQGKINPTEYNFNSNINIVSNILKKSFYYKDGFNVFSLEGNHFLILDKNLQKLLRKPANNKDIILCAMSSSFMNSKIYFDSKFNPFRYYASFHIHLNEINNDTTNIKVIVINPEVQNGQELFPNIHGGRTFINTGVKSSTIEEYEILLWIGKLLKVDWKMQPISYPVFNKDSLVEFKYEKMPN